VAFDHVCVLVFAAFVGTSPFSHSLDIKSMRWRCLRTIGTAVAQYANGWFDPLPHSRGARRRNLTQGVVFAICCAPIYQKHLRQPRR
jgi:hypothetical protein